MNKIIKQLFLFLIPTIIVMLVFIPINQQIIFTADDSDSDGGIAKIEQSAKHLNHNVLLLNIFFSTLTEEYVFSVLTAIGSISIFIFLLDFKNKLCCIKNHSPPISIFV